MSLPSTAIQERRSVRSGNLAINATQSLGSAHREALPPLKSPRGHLLDRIRSTPRSTGFVPQSTPPVDNTCRDTNESITECPPTRFEPSQSQRRVPPSKRTCSNNSPDPAHLRSTGDRRQQKPDPAHADQMVMLEQQLRAQTDLLTQQQTLLRHLQHQYNTPTHYATPPYTPQSASSRYAQAKPVQHDVVNMQNIAYDPTTGQYYAFAPQHLNLSLTINSSFAYNVTPPQKPQYTMSTPSSMPQTRAYQARSTTPLKEGQSSRQPKGPPTMDILLADADNQLNFSTRSRKRSTKILEAGLLRRRNSPAPQGTISRPASRASTRSNISLGSIEEAFPAIQIV